MWVGRPAVQSLPGRTRTRTHQQGVRSAVQPARFARRLGCRMGPCAACERPQDQALHPPRSLQRAPAALSVMVPPYLPHHSSPCDRCGDRGRPQDQAIYLFNVPPWDGRAASLARLGPPSFVAEGLQPWRAAWGRLTPPAAPPPSAAGAAAYWHSHHLPQVGARARACSCARVYVRVCVSSMESVGRGLAKRAAGSCRAEQVVVVVVTRGGLRATGMKLLQRCAVCGTTPACGPEARRHAAASRARARAGRFFPPT